MQNLSPPIRTSLPPIGTSPPPSPAVCLAGPRHHPTPPDLILFISDGGGERNLSSGERDSMDWEKGFGKAQGTVAGVGQGFGVRRGTERLGRGRGLDPGW
ncbi:unnamed protein product, partial [Cuscuta epithymum]